MKRVIYLLIIALAFLTGCERGPVADFDVSDINVTVGENVYFYNYSLNANDYEWDFGDGYYTYNEEPVHSYSEPGFYEVRLAAYYNDEVDYEYITIEVTDDPTYLTIEVLEYYDQYPVEDASIILYATYSDWVNETNPVIETFTGSDGVVIIEGLEARPYYIDVWHPYHDNYALADEDIDFIYIPSLVNGQSSYFTAWVDYVERPLKSKRSGERPKIVSEKHRKFSESIKP